MVETIGIFGLLGLALGSFMNSCAYRLPRKISLAQVRSFCPNCGHRLSWHELIPLVSFVLQKGRCRACKGRISWQYPIIEVIGGIAVILAISSSSLHAGADSQAHAGFQISSLFGICFGLLMLLIALIDFRHFIIPNELITIGAILGLLQVFVTSGSVQDSLLAGSGSLLLLLGVRAAGNWAFKQESMGMGDVKLAGVIGLFVGFVPFLVALWGASIAGMIYGLVRTHPPVPLLSPREGGVRGMSGLKIPFGTFLSVSSLSVIFFKSEVLSLLELWLTWNP